MKEHLLYIHHKNSILAKTLLSDFGLDLQYVIHIQDTLFSKE